MARRRELALDIDATVNFVPKQFPKCFPSHGNLRVLIVLPQIGDALNNIMFERPPTFVWSGWKVVVGKRN